mgnify:CR=1 FL=1
MIAARGGPAPPPNTEEPDMTTFLQVLLNGLMLGGLFAIVSIGLTLIFGIMGLAVKAGNEITLTFDGEDEEAAYAAVTEFVKANL